MKNTIGFCGCSYTEGFGLVNRQAERYAHLVSTRFGCDYANYAVGGSSNSDIFIQAIQSINENQITVVQWSSPGRAKFYHYDGYSTYTRGVESAHPDVTENRYRIFSDVFTILDSYYNQYHYLSKYVKSLNAIASNLNNKIFYINGLMYIDPIFLNTVDNMNFFTFNKITKNILNFENFPDEVIIKNIHTIRNYLKVVDHTWINSCINLADMRVDYGTDGRHPGLLSHMKYAEVISNFFNEWKIITK